MAEGGQLEGLLPRKEEAAGTWTFSACTYTGMHRGLRGWAAERICDGQRHKAAGQLPENTPTSPRCPPRASASPGPVRGTDRDRCIMQGGRPEVPGVLCHAAAGASAELRPPIAVR